MNKRFAFRARVVDAGAGGAFVRIPFDVETAFGRKRVPIQAVIDGVPYRGTLVRMGEPGHILIIIKEIRQRIGKTFGDEVEVILTEDITPRKVEIPDDLRQALEKEPQALAAFQRMSYTHQKEYVTAILTANRIETRLNRINRTIEDLKSK